MHRSRRLPQKTIQTRYGDTDEGKAVYRSEESATPGRIQRLRKQLSAQRPDSLGEIDVNARDQLGTDEIGEMMHRSDKRRIRRTLEGLRK